MPTITWKIMTMEKIRLKNNDMNRPPQIARVGTPIVRFSIRLYVLKLNRSRVGADPLIPKKPSRRNVAASKPSGHPYPPDRDEPQRAPADPVHSHAGGDPFRANLRVEDVGGNRNRSEEGVNRKGSRELPIHKPAFAIPEARVGVDHKGGLKDNDGGRHQSYGNNSAAFRSFFLFLNSSAADTW
jgi:hypothetical protein